MTSFENFLATSIKCKESKVKDAMNYSLLAGGKRLRPLLMFSVVEGFGIAKEKAYDAAASLEMIHTYSLIHDDLPAMDNDDIRRGRNTCHIEFDEATAILAGDGLLTYAFENIANSDYSVTNKCEIMKILAETSGSSGMIYGQILDMQHELKKEISIDDINECYHNKTARLFEAAFKIAFVLAGKIEYCKLSGELAYHLGLAFQIQDDLLDLEKTAEELGKSNSDIDNDKTTYISLLGEADARKAMNYSFDYCLDLIKRIEFDSKKIIEIIERIRYRNK